MTIFNKLIGVSNDIENLFNKHFEKQPKDENSPFQFEGWTDHFWTAPGVRKCHLKTIDRREDKKLWLMHINIYPDPKVLMPILGFDIIAGPGKITGAFFDYSSQYDHPYLDYLEMSTKNMRWSKPREIPDWGKKIFSTDVIAAGNIREGREMDLLLNCVLDLTKYYVENYNENAYSVELDMTSFHNMYCQKQKLNPKLHSSILNLGISEEDKDRYVNEVLFEEIS